VGGYVPLAMQVPQLTVSGYWPLASFASSQWPVAWTGVRWHVRKEGFALWLGANYHLRRW